MEILPGNGPGSKTVEVQSSGDPQFVEFHLHHSEGPPFHFRDLLWFLVSGFSGCPRPPAPQPWRLCRMGLFTLCASLTLS